MLIFMFSNLLSLAESVGAGMCGCAICRKKRALIGEPAVSGPKWRVGFGTSRLNREQSIASHIVHEGPWRLTPPRLLWKNGFLENP